MNYLNQFVGGQVYNGTPSGIGGRQGSDNPYQDQLNGLLSDPNSFSGTPGLQFALNSGLDGVNRQLAQRGLTGSGNQLAEIMKYGSGLAMQDYGNQVDRLGRLTGQQQQYQLGNKQADNSYTLGLGQNANTAQRNTWDYDLGQQQNALNSSKNLNQYNMDAWSNSINQQNANTNLANSLRRNKPGY